MIRSSALLLTGLALAACCTGAYASDPASHDVIVPSSGAEPLVVEWTGTAPVGAGGLCGATGDSHDINLTIPDGVTDNYAVSVDFHIEWEPGFTDPVGLVSVPDLVLSVTHNGTEVGNSDGGEPEENVGLLNPEAGTYTAVVCPYLAISGTAYRAKLTVRLAGQAACIAEPTKAIAASSVKSAPLQSKLDEEFQGWPNFDLFRSEAGDKSINTPLNFQGRYQSSQYDRTLGVPTFLWAKAGAKAAAVGPLTEKEQLIARARAQLRSEAKQLKLTAAMIDEAEVTNAQYNGKGPAVVRFQQRVNGLPVYGRSLNVLLDRAGQPIAVSGYFAPVDVAAAGGLTFVRSAAASVVSAWQSLGGTLDVSKLAVAKSAGEYQQFAVPVLTGTHFFERQPRVKKVMYARNGALVPAYYVELWALARADRSRSAYALIVSALDGHILNRRNMMSKAAYTYRTFADDTGIYQPFDEPVGNSYIPFTGSGPDDQPHPVPAAQNMVTLEHGPISTGDPWLADDAADSSGNHADACIDSIDIQGLPIAEPTIINNCIQGLELRAKPTSDHVFDYPVQAFEDPSTDNARNAAIVNMFYQVNWLHDWWYDHGFDEASGNAQVSNYGRGGAEGDPLLAQGQDGSGRNNANMATPADGSSPAMQQYLFDGPLLGAVEVTEPAAIAGAIPFNVVSYGPKTFDYTGVAALPDDGFDPGNDGCTGLSTPAVDLGLPIVGGVPSLAVPVVLPDVNLAGKIAVIVRGGGCPGSYKVRWALTSGASAVVLVHNEDGPPPPLVNGDLPIDLPILGQPTDVLYQLPIVVISKSDGQKILDQLAAGTPVSMHLKRDPTTDIDGTLDNLIIAHEYFHYVHHRLTVANSNQAGSMSEGWGDIDGWMESVRKEDQMVPGNDLWQGAYPGAPYVTGNYYFGIRRAPYTTDFAKNAFTFKHIAEGEPTPNGGDGTGNAEVHSAGEIWANMMFNCYAGILNDGEHTFEEARSAMQDYIIGGLKMTPADATYTEARDAVLSVALATNFQDYKACSHGFARRGAGLNAISPARASVDHVGVVEDYTEFVCPSATGPVTPVEPPVIAEATAPHSRFGGALNFALLLPLLGLGVLRRRRWLN